MFTDATVQQTEGFVQLRLKQDGTGHDWAHVARVRNMALHIAAEEGVGNRLIIELGALLHDIADWKFNDGDLLKGGEVTRGFLAEQGMEASVVTAVVAIVNNCSFKGAGVSDGDLSIEAKIVQDADRLDALGAIGIARAFAYGGSKGREIYNPKLLPRMHNSFEEYRSKQSTTVNHFYEKLLLLKDRMYTNTAKEIAKVRHVFMEQYLEELMYEIKGLPLFEKQPLETHDYPRDPS